MIIISNKISNNFNIYCNIKFIFLKIYFTFFHRNKFLKTVESITRTFISHLEQTSFQVLSDYLLTSLLHEDTSYNCRDLTLRTFFSRSQKQ